MSRCFPFPPPGYEEKRSFDASLLRKEKQKEKKHKKEKDREKREGKEKRDNERSKDKHREKKERKEKHKDKKDKDNNKTSDEKRNEGRKENCNGQLKECSYKTETLKDSKLVEDLGRRIRDEAAGNRNQVVQNFIFTNQRKNEGAARPMEQTENRAEGKDKSKYENKHNDRRAEKKSDRDKHRVAGNEMVRNINDQRRIEGSRATEKEDEKRIEDKKKVNNDNEVDRRGERNNKDREREEKRSKGKDKDRDKEKKKEKNKVKEHDNHRHNKEHDKLWESGRADIVRALNKDSENSVSSQGSLRKRKDSKELETNGSLHENDMRPSKLPRPASSPLHCENGRKSEAHHNAIPGTSDRQGSNDSRKMEIKKEHKVNGTEEIHPSSVVPRPSVSIEASENGEASTRLPHPDSKYLNQILSIPKMEEWSVCDDQEWLFGSNHLQPKPKAVECNSSEKPQVWAKALQIESADVHALPYVIPY